MAFNYIILSLSKKRPRFDLHQDAQWDYLLRFGQCHFIPTRSRIMITTSEIAVTITIWVLTAAGIFFGSRAAWRRRKKKRADRLKAGPHC